MLVINGVPTTTRLQCFRVILCAPDGERIGATKKETFKIDRNDWPAFFCGLVDLPAANFPNSGMYRLTLQINGLSLATQPLHVRRSHR
jgi:hypothetical protein